MNLNLNNSIFSCHNCTPSYNQIDLLEKPIIYSERSICIPSEFVVRSRTWWMPWIVWFDWCNRTLLHIL